MQEENNFQPDFSPQAPMEEAPKKSSKFGLILAAVVILAAVAGGAYYFFFSQSASGDVPPVLESEGSFQGFISTGKYNFATFDDDDEDEFEDVRKTFLEENGAVVTDIKQGVNYLYADEKLSFSDILWHIDLTNDITAVVARYNPAKSKFELFPRNTYYTKGLDVVEDPDSIDQVANGGFIVVASKATKAYGLYDGGQPALSHDICNPEKFKAGWNLVATSKAKLGDAIDDCLEDINTVWIQDRDNKNLFKKAYKEGETTFDSVKDTLLPNKIMWIKYSSDPTLPPSADDAVCGDGKVEGAEQCDGDKIYEDYTCEDYGYAGGTITCTDECEAVFSTCEEAVCGNDVKEEGEACDGEDFGTTTCESQGYVEGELSCNDDCTLDQTACVTDDECGNNVAGPTEECDGTDLKNATCESSVTGATGGSLSCDSECKLVTDECEVPVCGDDEINGQESCDGTDLGGKTCEDFGLVSGEISCLDSCRFDTSACESPSGDTCGNDQLDDGEQCDGELMGTGTCESLGFESGEVSCNDDCTYNTDSCEELPYCGDGEVNGQEQCDGLDFSGSTCIDIDVNGVNFIGGELICVENCTVDTSECLPGLPPLTGGDCGNSEIDGSEQCDTNNLNGKTCGDVLPGTAGVLSCNADCSFDTEPCKVLAVCGNNIAEIGEVCDGNDMNGKGCTDYGFDTGLLACKNDCTDYIYDRCYNEQDENSCGNGDIDDGEVCDGANCLADCTACMLPAGRGSYTPVTDPESDKFGDCQYSYASIGTKVPLIPLKPQIIKPMPITPLPSTSILPINPIGRETSTSEKTDSGSESSLNSTPEPLSPPSQPGQLQTEVTGPISSTGNCGNKTIDSTNGKLEECELITSGLFTVWGKNCKTDYSCECKDGYYSVAKQYQPGEEFYLGCKPETDLSIQSGSVGVPIKPNLIQPPTTISINPLR